MPASFFPASALRSSSPTPAPPWRPVSPSKLETSESPSSSGRASPVKQEAARRRRDILAANAAHRYEEWRATHPLALPATGDARRDGNLHHDPTAHKPRFRERERAKELGGDWASANRVPTAAQRIDQVLATSGFMKHPPYPKAGGGVVNREFSNVAASYNYRARQPSKEVAGRHARLTAKPRTESERIQTTIQDEQLRDTLAGGRWTQDPKYGNPVTMKPTTAAITATQFRERSPERWRVPSRGGFEYSFKPQGTEAVLALNEGVPFRDEFGFEPSLHLSGRRRERGRELGDDAGAFTGSVMPRNTYVAPSSPLGRALLYSPTTRPHSPASRASRGGGSPRGTPRDIPRDLALSFEETTADDDVDDAELAALTNEAAAAAEPAVGAATLTPPTTA